MSLRYKSNHRTLKDPRAVVLHPTNFKAVLPYIATYGLHPRIRIDSQESSTFGSGTATIFVEAYELHRLKRCISKHSANKEAEVPGRNLFKRGMPQDRQGMLDLAKSKSSGPLAEYGNQLIVSDGCLPDGLCASGADLSAQVDMDPEIPLEEYLSNREHYHKKAATAMFKKAPELFQPELDKMAQEEAVEPVKPKRTRRKKTDETDR